jgi:hypothetical protein
MVLSPSVRYAEFMRYAGALCAGSVPADDIVHGALKDLRHSEDIEQIRIGPPFLPLCDAGGGDAQPERQICLGHAGSLTQLFDIIGDFHGITSFLSALESNVSLW